MKKLLVMFLLFTLLLTACVTATPAGLVVDPAVAALEATMAVRNAAATIMAEQATQTQAAITPTIPATETPTVVPPTAAPTQDTTVLATAIKNTNCRLGPDAVFTTVEVIGPGISATVIAQNFTNGQWWKVRTVSGTECWVLESNVTLSGDPFTIPMVKAPFTPSPLPPPSWAGYWTMRMSEPGSDIAGSATNFQVLFVQNGNAVSFSYSLWGNNYGASGSISADGMTVSGNVGGDVWGANFILKRVPGNLNQFQGRWVMPGNEDGEFCGNKNGAGFPSPCRP